MAFSRENTADQGSNLNPIAGYASGYAYMHDESESSQMGPFLQVGSAPGGGLTGGGMSGRDGIESNSAGLESFRVLALPII